MNCDEFEVLGLDARRDGTLSVAERTAAREHVSFCARCASLEDAWLAASEELRVFREATQPANTPARVEMRLRQEFRTRHQTRRNRRVALIAGWVLATAAVLVGVVSWRNWLAAQHQGSAKQDVRPISVPEQAVVAMPADGGGNTFPAQPPRLVQAEPKSLPHRQLRNAAMTTTDSGTEAFTFLPGSFTAETADSAVVRVRMQRGALGALGLPVNEERAGEWVLVDLLVSNEGLPQAVRLPR